MVTSLKWLRSSFLDNNNNNNNDNNNNNNNDNNDNNSVWTEWLTWVTDALGAWFAPGWCTKRKPAKTVIIETNYNNNRLIIIIR